MEMGRTAGTQELEVCGVLMWTPDWTLQVDLVPAPGTAAWWVDAKNPLGAGGSTDNKDLC
jgi:hypothetical protein